MKKERSKIAEWTVILVGKYDSVNIVYQLFHYFFHCCRYDGR